MLFLGTLIVFFSLNFYKIQTSEMQWLILATRLASVFYCSTSFSRLQNKYLVGWWTFCVLASVHISDKCSLGLYVPCLPCPSIHERYLLLSKWFGHNVLICPLFLFHSILTQLHHLEFLRNWHTGNNFTSGRTIGTIVWNTFYRDLFPNLQHYHPQFLLHLKHLCRPQPQPPLWQLHLLVHLPFLRCSMAFLLVLDFQRTTWRAQELIDERENM